jgi:hypothetical protein
MIQLSPHDDLMAARADAEHDPQRICISPGIKRRKRKAGKATPSPRK